VDLGLTGKVVIISGGSKGIGKAIATSFAQEGCRVSFCARGRKVLLDTLYEIKSGSGNEDVMAVEADMSRIEEIRGFVEKTLGGFGRIDILVNNAGSNPLGKFQEVSDDIWLSSWSLKFLGYVRLAREVFPHMQKGGGGNIINIIGAAGRQPIPDYVTGSAINAALMNFTKYLAAEARKHNITVNGVNPGLIRTERFVNFMNKMAEDSRKDPTDVERELMKSLSLDRIGTADDIASLVIFMASEKAGYVNGEIIQADGGLVKSI
jgi:NAD(P)-dependent dehydrogenase (short-subunit alcohol dehydrogenase family)